MIIYNPMTPKEATSLFLVMFTVVCALPAAGVALIPSAIAQEEDDDDGMSLDEAENLASDTVSNVLDNDNTAGDDTEVSVPITDIDQTDANVGLNLALEEVKITERTVTRDPECPPIGDFPSTFNPVTNLCEASAPPACEAGGMVDPETDLCPGGIEPSCPVEGDFKYNTETNLCEASAPPICTVGTFNPATDQCE